MDQIALGIDIGGTFTKLSLVSRSGEIIAKTAFPTHSSNGHNTYPERLIHAAKQLAEQAPAPLLGVGIGAPGCDPDSGYISYAVNLPFDGPFPIRHFFEQELCAHTELVKDSSAAALGEKMWGGARHMDNFIFLTLGTGLGSAFFINGRLVTGAHGLAGEMGHTMHQEGERACRCGRSGCLETYVSASGLMRTFQVLMGEELTPSLLRKLPYSERTSRRITEAALGGDSLARKALELTGHHLGGALARVVMQTDPEGIFLAGGLTNAGDLLLEPLKNSLNDMLLPAFKNKTTLTLSVLGADKAGTIGAAAQVFFSNELAENQP